MVRDPRPALLAVLPLVIACLGPRAAAAAPPRCAAPPLPDVIRAALREAGLERGQARSWRRRLRWAALVPQVSSRFSRSQSWAELADVYPERPDRLDSRTYSGLRWQVAAQWNLARLLFDPRELGVARQALRIGRERRRLEQRVVELYFERCRLLVMSERPGDAAPAGDSAPAEHALRAARIGATLDAWTGGMFARELNR